MDRPQDQCGVFAIDQYRGPDTACQIAYLGLLALQHRGQESAGMAYNGTAGLECHKGMGLVAQVFSSEMRSAVTARSVLGHVRYSTAGSSSIADAQPLLARSINGCSLALAHNGNLSNNAALQQSLLEQGHIFHASSDTETMLAYIFRYRNQGAAEAVSRAMSVVQGAYAAVLTDGDQMVAFRDPHGFRPLVMGHLGEAVVFASETCALDAVRAVFDRELAPGEVVTACRGRISSRIIAQYRRAFCVFEYIYFARPDSTFHGKNVHQVRRAVGARLARQLSPDVKIDLVIPSPDSGVSAAIGFAEAAGLPLEWGIHRNPYGGRTFIQPSPGQREMAARHKYNPVRALVRGKSAAVIDDSLVRGTTARKITALLREAGVTGVHLFIAAPPYSHRCCYGIDIPDNSELAACGGRLDELARSIGADSLTFTAPQDLYDVLGYGAEQLCTACFTGSYPTSRQC